MFIVYLQCLLIALVVVSVHNNSKLLVTILVSLGLLGSALLLGLLLGVLFNLAGANTVIGVLAGFWALMLGAIMFDSFTEGMYESGLVTYRPYMYKIGAYSIGYFVSPVMSLY